jgi:hypothetical protein
VNNIHTIALLSEINAAVNTKNEAVPNGPAAETIKDRNLEYLPENEVTPLMSFSTRIKRTDNPIRDAAKACPTS